MDDAPMLLTEKGKPDTTSRGVLQALAEHAHKDGSGARPSVMRLQYRTGYDRRTVQRALRRLEDAELIVAEGVVRGCTLYRLMLQKIRPESDWAALEAEEERLREATAARVRKHRAKRVTQSDDVTVTHSDDVTEPDVTHSASVRNDVEQRYEADVTHSDDVRNALSAARTNRNHPTTEPPGNHHYPAPVPNVPAARAAAEVEEDRRPAWLAQLQAALSANGIDVPWKFQGDDQLLLQNDVQRLGIPIMVRFAVQAAQGAQRGPFSSRFFYPGWRAIPTPVDPNVVPLQPKSRQQQETDDQFDRAMARAQNRMQESS
ncbi:helix-turn-helix domain-containing protein [Kitasatospora sp. NPDC004669]|uniref:helix-turn-helix domain-containing protein n=1 Tax=Kitasatospora sp. NPDC004669 TaxID=3154555 RepID=UPI0033BEABA2